MRPVKRIDQWCLVVHYWPRAALHGVDPKRNTSSTQTYYNKNDPAYYTPHSFLFLKPPTKEEFLAVCQQSPWTAVWDTSLLVLIRKSKWPRIKGGHKRVRLSLKNKSVIIGELVIERTTVWENKGVSV